MRRALPAHSLSSGARAGLDRRRPPPRSLPPPRFRGFDASRHRLGALAAAALCLVPSGSPASGALDGFSPSTARVERDWKERFAAIPSPDRIREHMRLLSARPHHVGSPYDETNASWILARFRAWGLDARIERFDVLFPTPRVRVLELVAPTRFVAALAEPAVRGDPLTPRAAGQGMRFPHQASNHCSGCVVVCARSCIISWRTTTVSEA